MKRIKYWALAAAMICGSPLFTACSNSSDDDVPVPDPESKEQKERTELLMHIQDDTKKISENLDAEGVSMTTQLNAQLMTLMGKGRNFTANLKQLIAMMAVKDAVANAKQVEPGSELEKMGYKAYLPVDISAFGVRVVFNERGDYNITPTNGLEFIFPATIEGLGTTIYKMAFKNSGQWYESISTAQQFNAQGLALINRIPTAITMTLSGLYGDEEVTLLKGVINIAQEKTDESAYIRMEESSFRLSGQLTSLMQGYGLPDNDEQLLFEIIMEHSKVTSSTFDFTQNGLKLFHLASTSIGDQTSSLKLDILDDLTIAGTIDGEERDLTITCQHGITPVPMQLIEEEIDGQKTIMPAFKFPGETPETTSCVITTGELITDFIPLSQLVDQETMDCFNSISSVTRTSLSDAASTYKQMFSSLMQIIPMNSEEWGF